MAYDYDAVGSARKMLQTSGNLTGQAEDAVTIWEYDDRYRLVSETISPDSSPVSTRTLYGWDSADNRTLKAVYATDGTSTSLTSQVMYNTANALNQMTGWADGTTQVTYQPKKCS